MAHRLPWHEAGCRNVHGHGYRMEVELTGEPMMNGMVLDYFELSSLVEPLVREVDHAFLCDTSDELMRDFLSATGLKVVFVEFSTTAENIAAWFYERLADMFVPMKHLVELRVRISETERTWAEVKGPLRVAIPRAELLSQEHRGHMLE